MQTPNTLNITVGTDVILNVTLEHDGVVLNPALIDNLQANLITGLGRKTPLETSTGIDYIVVNIPWVDGRLPGCYSLEITGSINDLAWSAVGKSIIRYTSATEIGRSTVDVSGDSYDVTMEVGYYYTDSPIEAVHVSVDDGVGTPSATPSYMRKVLGIDFHNLKGNGIKSIEQTTTSTEDHGVNIVTITDDLGNATGVEIRNGGTGPQGRQGIPGTGAIWTGEGEEIITLEQEPGSAINKAMSQAAVTEEFVKVAYTEEAASTEGKIDFTTKYITTNNEWSTSQSGKNNGRMIPITPGKIYKVVATVGANRLAILKSSNSTTVDFCDDYPSVIPMAAQGDQYLFVAPSDANYLYHATYMSSSARTVSIYEEKPIIEKVEEIEDEIEDIKSENESIKETLIVKEKQTLSSSNNGFVGGEDTWTGVPNGNWKHAVTDIIPGKHYRIESERATSINVLKSYTKPTTDGGIPDFSEEEGFTGRIMVDVSPYKYDFVAPSDAAKLVVCTQRRDNNVNYPTNTKVYETMPVNQAIEEGIGGNAKQVKMLVIGDSWGRDIATELQPAAADMGLNLYVAQAYQGASGLYNQFKGMDDPTRHYTHGTGSSAYEQYVQGTYQLWTYTSDTPTKTPSTGYNNGKCGVDDGTAYGKVSVGGAWAAKTLDEILASQDWDIILIRLHCGELQVEDSLMADEEDEDKRYFDINDFIERMEDSLTTACKAKVKWGLATTWSYPVEAYNIERDKIKSMLKAMDLYDSWNGMSAADKQAVFNGIYDTMQTNFQKVCKHLGDKLSYAVNIAKAIQEARNSAWLGDIGYHLNRSSSDMHLSNGIPKYICALAILYSIFDKGRNALKFGYIPDLVDGSGTDSDGGSDDSAVTPTKALCVGAQAVAWEAVCNMI